MAVHNAGRRMPPHFLRRDHRLATMAWATLGARGGRPRARIPGRSRHGLCDIASTTESRAATSAARSRASQST